MTSPFDPEFEDEPSGSTAAELAFLVEQQRNVVVAVATGTSIASKEREYDRRRPKIRTAFKRIGVEDPFPWPDLHSFWAYIKDWSTYAERREVLRERFDPIIEMLKEMDDSIPSWDLPEAGSWAGLSQRAADLKNEYASAQTIDDFQDVGRRARTIIIESVKLAWDESMIPPGEQPPKGDDAKAKLDQILATRLSGSGSQRIRKFIRAALELGHEGTHSESQEGFDAMAAAMGALMAVKLLAELASDATGQLDARDV